MYSFDFFVQNYFVERSEFATDIIYAITSIFDGSFHFVFLVLCITFLIYLVRGFYYLLLFFGSLFLGAVVVFILKNIFDVARPLDGFIIALSNSFPSQHATSATIFFVMLMYVFHTHFKSVGRVIFNSICIAGIILVAFSRVYLGVHWLSDVLFGIILGIFISYISIIVFKRVIFDGNSRLPKMN